VLLLVPLLVLLLLASGLPRPSPAWPSRNKGTGLSLPLPALLLLGLPVRALSPEPCRVAIVANGEATHPTVGATLLPVVLLAVGKVTVGSSTPLLLQQQHCCCALQRLP
jgi:hypothetical protein